MSEYLVGVLDRDENSIVCVELSDVFFIGRDDSKFSYLDCIAISGSKVRVYLLRINKVEFLLFSN